MHTQHILKITSFLESLTCFNICSFLRDLCDKDRFATSYMRHYVFRYTIQEALTIHAWQLYEQMAGSPHFSILETPCVEGAFKNVSICKEILAFNSQKLTKLSENL